MKMAVWSATRWSSPRTRVRRVRQALASRSDAAGRRGRDVGDPDRGEREVAGVDDREGVADRLARCGDRGRVGRLGDGERWRLGHSDRDDVGGGVDCAARGGRALGRGVVDDRAVVDVGLGHRVGAGEDGRLVRQQSGRCPEHAQSDGFVKLSQVAVTPPAGAVGTSVTPTAVRVRLPVLMTVKV